MKTATALLLIVFLFFSTPFPTNARIINVPEDRNSIQGGINQASNGDTVLVQPGTYNENLVFPQRSLTVASLFLTTGNTAYIDSTIIHSGDDNTSVIRIILDEEEDIVLAGFTIEGGIASYGAGIYLSGGTPLLSHLVIKDNEASNRGGGIYITRGSTPVISNTMIYDNNAELGGGIAFYKEGCGAEIIRTLITDNLASERGGGIYAEGSWLEMDHVTIAYNEAEQNYEGIVITNNTLSMSNSIMWGHESVEIWGTGGRLSIDISFSDIEDGEDGIEANGGYVSFDEGSIDEDPLFVDANEGDFHLEFDSPCIDSGDPDAEHDPDGTRTDMGALPFRHGGTIEVTVFDAAFPDPLESALVRTSFSVELLTDENGFCRFDRTPNDEFNLLVSHTGHNDSLLTGLEVEIEDTLRIEFRLLHPEIVLSSEGIQATLMPGNSSDFEFTITNHGNGPLSWTIKPELTGESGSDPWIRRHSLPVGEIVNDSRIEGAVMVGDHYYISGANRQGVEDGTNQIYVLNRDGEEVERFDQAGESDYGYRDMAWDGELIWGSGENIIYGFTLEGELRRQIEGPENNHQALAWDSENNLIWMCGITSHEISGYDRAGNAVTTIPQFGLRIYGLAYWKDDPDGYPLYVAHSIDDRIVLSKINPEIEQTIFVHDLETDDGGSTKGLFISKDYDRDCWVLLSTVNSGREDRVDIWQLQSFTDWMIVEPDSSVTPAGEDEAVTLTLDASELEERIYEGVLIITHNAGAGETLLPISLNVTENAIDLTPLIPHPSSLILYSAYPNPFNSTTVISFTLPTPGQVRLVLYDLHGREIRTLSESHYDQGSHRINVDLVDLPSGVYVYSLQVGRWKSARKMVLLR
ncbi:right-handed parallel beta-helix repeat-containing protein [bacterium]|nr:right-handed parallel beta-helix repeat-containing protein [bacterium]